MKILYLFNKIRKDANLPKNLFFGMHELRSIEGVSVDYLEIEDVYPAHISRFLRKWVVSMHTAHIPIFHKFFKYDIVFSSTAYGALLIKSILNIKSFKWVLLDFNIIDTIGDRKSLRQKIFYYAVSKVDAIVTISEAEKRKIQNMFPDMADKIVFFHEPTDLEFFKPNDSFPKAKYILSVGTFGRDFKTVIEAVRGTNIELRIATKPSQTKSLSIPNNVSVKMYSPEELLKMYNECSLVFIGLEVNDSSSDSVGTLTIGEAMSMGKAIVVTRTQNMESYVQDGVNAIFVPRHDVTATRNAIIDILKGKDRQKILGENARTFAVKHLSLDLFANRLYKLFSSLLEKSANQ